MEKNKSYLSMMAKILAILIVLPAILFAFRPADTNANEQFMFGAEILVEEQKELLKGKRVGLVTNPTGVD